MKKCGAVEWGFEPGSSDQELYEPTALPLSHRKLGSILSTTDSFLSIYGTQLSHGEIITSYGRIHSCKWNLNFSI
jgi:hypothetical protein